MDKTKPLSAFAKRSGVRDGKKFKKFTFNWLWCSVRLRSDGSLMEMYCSSKQVFCSLHAHEILLAIDNINVLRL